MAMATETAMVTTTTFKQQSTKRGSKTNGATATAAVTASVTATETAKVTAGDVGGGGGDTAIAATGTAMAVMIAGSFSVKTYRDKESEPPNQRSIPLHVHRILFMNNGWGVL